MFFFAAVTMAVWAVFIFLPFYYTPAVVLVLVWIVKTIKANIERLEKAYSAKAGHKIKLDGFMRSRSDKWSVQSLVLSII